SSPDAPDDLNVTDEGFRTTIKIGDPDTTITGQHRYTLSYTLPDAQVTSGVLNIDIFAPDEFVRDHFEAVVRGFELDDPRCFVGANGATGERFSQGHHRAPADLPRDHDRRRHRRHDRSGRRRRSPAARSSRGSP